MKKLFHAACVAAAACLMLAAPAHAQGAFISGSISAAVDGDHVSPSFAGFGGWRFNQVLGFGLELTHTTDLHPDRRAIYYCCDRGSKTNITTFTTNLRLEIPTVSTRILPFVVAGGGIAATTSSSTVFYALSPEVAAQLVAASGLVVNTIPAGPIRVENTTTEMALTLGGGASFLLTQHLSVDVDLRLLHTLGSESGNIGRFGGGVSYRF
jgi:opacity protein-like surface antigen